MSDQTNDSDRESRGRSGSQPNHDDSTSGEERLALYSKRVENTRNARLETARRIELRGDFWGTALVLMALSGTIITFCSLVNPSIYSGRGDVISAIVGVVVLAVSLVVTKADFSGRSKELFRHYLELQKISIRLESLRLDKSEGKTNQDNIELEKSLKKLIEQYTAELGMALNHSTADFYSTLSKQERCRREIDNSSYRRVMWSSWTITLIPLVISGLSLLSLFPLVVWMLNG